MSDRSLCVDVFAKSRGTAHRGARGRSVIVVAHRLTTVQRADRIAVVDHATIVEQGSHDELMSLAGSYARLVNEWNSAQPMRG